MPFPGAPLHVVAIVPAFWCKSRNESRLNTLNILFDANPYILNLEPYEIDNYIKNRLEKNETLEDIIDDMDSNPYLFNEL